MVRQRTKNIHPLHCELLLDVAKRGGVSLDQLYKKNQLEQMKTRQHPRRFAALLLKLQKASQHPAICAGFEYGRQLDLACAGVIGQAVMSAPTLAVALELMCRYYILMGPRFYFQLKNVAEETSVAIDLAYNYTPEPVRAFVFEALLSSWQQCTQVLIGRPLQPIRICLDYPAPAHAHLYREQFQCNVQFNCPQTLISASEQFLAQAVTTANGVVHKHAVAHCESALLNLGSALSLSDKIRRYLKMSMDIAHVSLDSMARTLNFSARTLNRRLQAEGSSFQMLLDERRREHACRLLARGDVKLDRIAEKLGYSDSSNFRRAFKRWTGETPSSYRKLHCSKFSGANLLQ